MRHSILTAMPALMCIVGVFPATGFSQEPSDPRVASVPAATRADRPNKFSFILFWKANDANTQQLTESLKLAVSKRAERAEWSNVNVTDAANRALVERYQVSRMPMPTVLCVAPNGAITGAFVRKITDEGIEGAIVSPATTEVVKAVQDKKIVVVHIKHDARSPLPAGVVAFMADPAFQARTSLVTVLASDPVENRLLTGLEIKAADVSDSITAVIAPPGAMVGKFSATATNNEIAAALHAAGKCCNDANCKHNQKGQQQ